MPRRSPKNAAEFRRNFLERIDTDGPLLDPELAEETCPETPCHLWLGSTRDDGYGRVTLKGKWYPAHRVAFLLSGRKTTDEEPYVLHRCGRLDCVNPEHLRAGSRREVTTGIAGSARGEGVHGSVLTEQKVREMVTLRGANSRRWTYTMLAERYGVSRYTVRSVFRGRTWAWLTGLGGEEG